MIPLVDARSGKVVQLGEKIVYDTRTGEGSRVEAIDAGLFSAKARVRTWGSDGQERVAVVPVSIRYFPKLTYGPAFPVAGLRVAILPS